MLHLPWNLLTRPLIGARGQNMSHNSEKSGLKFAKCRNNPQHVARPRGNLRASLHESCTL
eukprot:310677-Lingulodinium_polyedra.AAC.1